MAMTDGCVFRWGRMRSMSMTGRNGIRALEGRHDDIGQLAAMTPSAVSPVTPRSGAAQPYPMMSAEVSTRIGIHW